MAKYLIQGSYTQDGLDGLLKDGGTKRRDAAKKALEGVGGTMESFSITRGSYDFVGVVSGTSFEGAAAVKLAVEASGAITNFTILEEMDMSKTAEMAAKAMASYKPAG